MEKIMNKSNDHVTYDTFTVRELRDDELQHVSGGRFGTQMRFDRLEPAPFSIDIGTSENLVVNASSSFRY
jgi:bacteriocin-like protein